MVALVSVEWRLWKNRSKFEHRKEMLTRPKKMIKEGHKNHSSRNVQPNQQKQKFTQFKTLCYSNFLPANQVYYLIYIINIIIQFIAYYFVFVYIGKYVQVVGIVRFGTVHHWLVGQLYPFGGFIDKWRISNSSQTL